MKAGVWILVALTFAAGALAQAPQERPDWKLFFSDQAVDGTIVIADERSGEMLAYDVERAQKRFMPASTLKCLMPCLRSMPERSVTSSSDSVGWRETGL